LKKDNLDFVERLNHKTLLGKLNRQSTLSGCNSNYFSRQNDDDRIRTESERWFY